MCLRGALKHVNTHRVTESRVWTRELTAGFHLQLRSSSRPSVRDTGTPQVMMHYGRGENGEGERKKKEEDKRENKTGGEGGRKKKEKKGVIETDDR